MRKNFIIAYSFILLALSLISFPHGAMSALMIGGLTLLSAFLIKKYELEDHEYLITILIVGIVARVAFGLLVYNLSLQDFFGGDAVTYDMHGQRLVELWTGVADPREFLSTRASSTTGPGWGMNYLTGAIYFFSGQSILVAQSFCAVIGAATAPMVFFCALKVFNNRRVARTAALISALFPSFIIWSSQLMKDGLIIFLLVLTMTMVLELQKKFSLSAVFMLVFSMFGILSLRFYIFYMLAVAVVGSFIIGLGASPQSVVRRIAVVVLLGLALTYLGVIRNASSEFEKFGSLERVNQSRQDLVNSANTGFGADTDVSTAEGAITAIPVGFLYLMLAPFPWQLSNLRQAITFPEVMIWWACIPIILSGLWYTIRHRLREAVPILVFSLMLSLAYSIFQGNVGTAYRQRTQIQVFLFIFASVGWTLYKEKKENAVMRKNFRKKASMSAKQGH